MYLRQAGNATLMQVAAKILGVVQLVSCFVLPALGCGNNVAYEVASKFYGSSVSVAASIIAALLVVGIWVHKIRFLAALLWAIVCCLVAAVGYSRSEMVVFLNFGIAYSILAAALAITGIQRHGD